MKVDDGLVHRLFYPQVPVVMAAAHGGRVSAMPVVSYSAVSASPPIIVVSCYPGGFTYSLAVKSGAFSICVLGRRHLAAVGRLAALSGSGVKDKLRKAGFSHSKGPVLGVPLIDGAEATLECRVASRRKTGDHVLVIGRVASARTNDKFSGSWDFERYHPILYTGWRDGMTVYPGP
ncbi:MAG: flavin reductase [Thaumarchaeota archaeon]|nr:flavin reductase [Nitrososphaerota archaeon]